jgi:hypothetical protein
MSITDEMVEELEAEARMSTLGIWTAEDSPGGGIYISGECAEFICGAIYHVHDANFIALANPATILALLAERAELVRDRERLDWLADPDNTIGNVQLPLKCVTANVHSLRDAIDAARGEA